MTNEFFPDDFDCELQPEDLIDDNPIDEDFSTDEGLIDENDYDDQGWLDEDHLYDETNESKRWRTSEDDE